MKRWLLFILLLIAGAAAQAHKPSDSYLSLKPVDNRIEGQWDIALRDLDFAIGLDSDNNGEITWGELKSRHDAIAAYALARLKLSAGGEECPTHVVEQLVDKHSDGAYAVLRFAAQCAKPVTLLTASYSLFHDIDPQHKGLLRLELPTTTVTGIFSPEKATQQFSVGGNSKLDQFGEYMKDGVWHIWTGFDHVLFLLSLLLPAVLVRPERRWQPVAGFRPAFWEVLKIVTAFTLAHSITLSLATLGVVQLPSRLVESCIALSVVVAAANNLYPLMAERRWIAAFLFGLIHGFGFASVLVDLGLPKNILVLALVGFNLGVEVGQIAIVTSFLPLAYALRATAFYRRAVLYGGSLVIVVVAGLWLLERAFNLKFMPV
ncbi:MAG TPA: HupE/UreJ family protein [Rhodocyclaceae bacterium]